MVVFLLQKVPSIASIRKLCFTHHLAVLICSKRSNGSKHFTYNHEHKTNNYEKSHHSFLTYVTLFTSGICCYALYSFDDVRKNILYSLKNVILPTVSAKDIPQDVFNNRSKYNFIADVVEVSAPAVVYIEIKDHKRYGSMLVRKSY